MGYLTLFSLKHHDPSNHLFYLNYGLGAKYADPSRLPGTFLPYVAGPGAGGLHHISPGPRPGSRHSAPVVVNGMTDGANWTDPYRVGPVWDAASNKVRRRG